MTVTDIVEIFILFVAVYFAIRFLQGTRGVRILLGLIVVTTGLFVGVLLVAQWAELDRVNYLLHQALPMSLFTLVVLFQPELRRGLMRLGRNPLAQKFLRDESALIEEIIRAVSNLSKEKIGALIAVEREISLSTYVEGGVFIDAEVKADLVDTIFWPGSALHDGAIVIQNERVAAAGCLFPLTENPDVSKRLGTRHRAAIGLTEETDAVTIVVSEETGNISVGVRGHLERDLDRDSLRRILSTLLTGHE